MYILYAVGVSGCVCLISQNILSAYSTFFLSLSRYIYRTDHSEWYVTYPQISKFFMVMGLSLALFKYL